MISFRHHVVSLVAVLLALATGVALGGGPLSELGREADADLRAENSTLRAELASARSATGLADELAGEHAATLAKGTLADRQVALVTLPGADGDVVDALEALVIEAGGTVSGRHAVGSGAYDRAGKSLVETLGAQLAEGQADIPAAATTYARLGHLLGLAVTGADDTLVSSLAAAELMTSEGEAATGSLALVVLGDDDADSVAPALAALLSGLAGQLEGTVVLGDSQASGDAMLAALRADDTFDAAVRTADGAESAAGRLVAVLALAEQVEGDTWP